MSSQLTPDVDWVSEPTQRIVKARRDYNTWVAQETMEDYALRYTPSTFRKWSIGRITNTAFGAISFLVLEAIGGTILVKYGFVNSFWAILTVGLIVFLTGLPISYYAAKHGLDMDLLTRGAGFGYIGSTIASFIYASFTFILFALEAAIMAYALELSFNLPLYLGYLLSALVVIPVVTHGVTLISRIQMVTMPIWVVLMLLPVIAIFYHDPHVLGKLYEYDGHSATHGFNLLAYGGATVVGAALVTQIGEQVDYLRFMPKKTPQNQWAWNAGVLAAGPGWVLVGMFKMLMGTLLAFMMIEAAMPIDQVVNPTHMYMFGFSQLISHHGLLLGVTALFVIISQFKINMTNAYAGSLAWSNFFARLTHSHPGRVVWVVFNAFIAIMLMEMDVFQALEQVLALYSNVAISWIAAVVADLVINKPLGLSPKGIEFRRAYLHDINPVGVGAMLIASVMATFAYVGAFGEVLQAFSAFLALGIAFVISPIIAWLTKGRYYIARKPYQFPFRQKTEKCSICEREYETEDMAHCPAYQGFICSLCCCLDARCHDACKPHAKFSTQWQNALKSSLPALLRPYLKNGLSNYLLVMSVTLLLLAGMLGITYYHQASFLQTQTPALLAPLKTSYIKIFWALAFVSAVVAWWLVLTAESRRVAQTESNRQTSLLLREIELHKQTDAELQLSRKVAEQANSAKSRYISGISHELRTPLNSILGYAQLLDGDESIPVHRRQAIRVIRRSGEHLLSLIEGTLDIARIESGKLTFDMKPLRFPEFIQQIVSMFELQAKNKELAFKFELKGDLPQWVRADQKRLTQILINLLGNAVKFTKAGQISFRVRYAREIAHIEIEDTGPGIQPEEYEKIFEPFVRGSASNQINTGGTGLGLTISKLLTELMGGELMFESRSGVGTKFIIRLFLPQIHQEGDVQAEKTLQRVGYEGRRRKVLVVDNEQNDRELIVSILAPLGFDVIEAANGQECLDIYQNAGVDAILMDLAMPIMDGWEAAYVIRKVHHSNLPIAIISANAFDKNLDNNAGIDADSFIVKPVNVEELLDWLGQHMQLKWTLVHEPSFNNPYNKAIVSTNLHTLPPQQILDELLMLVNRGHIKGIQQKLDEILAIDSRYADFVKVMRHHSNQFQMEEMKSAMQGIK